MNKFRGMIGNWGKKYRKEDKKEDQNMFLNDHRIQEKIPF